MFKQSDCAIAPVSAQFFAHGDQAQAIVSELMVEMQRRLIARHNVEANRRITRIGRDDPFGLRDRCGGIPTAAAGGIDKDILDPCDVSAAKAKTQKSGVGTIRNDPVEFTRRQQPFGKRFLRGMQIRCMIGIPQRGVKPTIGLSVRFENKPIPGLPGWAFT